MKQAALRLLKVNREALKSISRTMIKHQHTTYICNVLYIFFSKPIIFLFVMVRDFNISKPTYALLYHGIKLPLFSFWYAKNSGNNISHLSLSWKFGFVTEMLLIF
jgi:hypothetical protein